MAKHHPDLIFCRKQAGVAIGRLCEKCDGKCVICDSYVRPCTLVRICDECNYGSYQGRCVICGGPGVSDAYYCKECTIQEKDDVPVLRRNSPASQWSVCLDPVYPQHTQQKPSRSSAHILTSHFGNNHETRGRCIESEKREDGQENRKPRDGCPKIVNLGSSKTDLFYERKKYGFKKR
ncbi:PHD finger-like domain-containing protein 5A [Pteropus alecto]|uniref:PHD finger-like domain-containing protein 5A n=1 Tax=Pteropus alecto TaxID=9402 RepID=L5KB37_PTEAL|nr:PHD finger-like domain-containing protein 5A [Pteropus alecto]